MPYAAPTRCHCGAKATRHGRCANHQRKPWSKPSKNTQQLTSAERARFRKAQLAREPQCRVCGSVDNLEADHIIEIADGGSKLAAENGQTLCHDHHVQKTLAAKRARRRAAQRRGGES